MNANELKNDSAAELRRVAIVEMFNRFKENLLPPAPGQGAERATRMIDTLKLCVQALETLPGNKSAERTMRSLKKAIQEQEKWKAKCES